MPGLVTCQGSSLETQWNVGSDDFVMPSFLKVVLTLLWLARYAVRIVYLAKCVVIACIPRRIYNVHVYSCTRVYVCVGVGVCACV